MKGTESKLFEVQCGVSVVCDVSCCQQVLVMIDPLFLQSTCPLYPNYQMIYWQCYYSAWLFSELFWLEPYRESIKATWASKNTSALPPPCHTDAAVHDKRAPTNHWEYNHSFQNLDISVCQFLLLIELRKCSNNLNYWIEVLK